MFISIAVWISEIPELPIILFERSREVRVLVNFKRLAKRKPEKSVKLLLDKFNVFIELQFYSPPIKAFIQLSVIRLCAKDNFSILLFRYSPRANDLQRSSLTLHLFIVSISSF